MTSVTRNLLIDHYRRTKRTASRSLDDKMPVVENKDPPGAVPTSKAAWPTEQPGAIGVTRLSPELREAVILRDLQQLEYGEIQRVLAVPKEL